MRHGHIRLAAPAIAVAVWTIVHLERRDACEVVGQHDAYWETPTLRVCRRKGCTATWRREPEPEGVTTTNARHGW